MPRTPASFWNGRYQSPEYAYGREPNDFLRAHASLFPPGAKILCLAEGEGRNGVFLAQQGYSVRGVDFSIPGRDKALALARETGVHIDYDLADLTTYDMGDAALDGIVSIFCHLSEHDRPALYASIIQALKPGGIFLLESYNQRQPSFGTGGPKDPSELLSSGELNAAFDGFEIVLAQDVERTILEGVYHTGPSSVTQFIARKPS